MSALILPAQDLLSSWACGSVLLVKSAYSLFRDKYNLFFKQCQVIRGESLYLNRFYSEYSAALLLIGGRLFWFLQSIQHPLVWRF